ncbi:ComEA family DNA-binding protein [Desulfogranum marinum]|uniref:ComEA family DNA-binding protein n=1 Tax=Desulfogranum marinum TaxID=453220 RepID=UPI0019662D64|nr:ComEA family DNA-binding protein [Desulfogranum marinum]MBM9513986.1 ComEA family DNA-binding protein [Desulfogranum marinum]
MKKITLTLFFVLFFAVAALAKVNINTATVDELTSLPGIGQAKAEAIVKYRDQAGKFKTVEDVTNVKGIGDKMLKKIKSEITVGS